MQDASCREITDIRRALCRASGCYLVHSEVRRGLTAEFLTMPARARHQAYAIRTETARQEETTLQLWPDSPNVAPTRFDDGLRNCSHYERGPTNQGLWPAKKVTALTCPVLVGYVMAPQTQESLSEAPYRLFFGVNRCEEERLGVDVAASHEYSGFTAQRTTALASCVTYGVSLF